MFVSMKCKKRSGGLDRIEIDIFNPLMLADLLDKDRLNLKYLLK